MEISKTIGFFWLKPKPNFNNEFSMWNSLHNYYQDTKNSYPVSSNEIKSQAILKHRFKNGFRQNLYHYDNKNCQLVKKSIFRGSIR